ncbi:MAG: hypothetical protein P0120_15155 [Nitrospira sp.]|nr:hypothetical protein [Nitrospira sp.]
MLESQSWKRSNQTIRKRLPEIDKTLLEQDTALVDLYEKLLPLLQPPLDTPKRRIGFQSKGKREGDRHSPLS